MVMAWRPGGVGQVGMGKCCGIASYRCGSGTGTVRLGSHARELPAYASHYPAQVVGALP